MAYREPKLQIFQDFEAALAGGAQPLFACCVGPNYELHRFNEDDEKAKMGDYDEIVPSTVYLWPDHIAGGVIDTDDADIWLENTQLNYYSAAADVLLTADNGNRINSASTVYKTNAAAVRDAAFGTRDVQVGDVAKLAYINPDTTMAETFETTVAGFDTETVAGTTAPPSVLATGFGDTTAGATELIPLPAGFTAGGGQTDGYTYSLVNVYAGLVDGFPMDTYTLRTTAVGTGTVSGGDMDGTEITISSIGGDSNVVTLNAGTWDTGEYIIPIGARGATLAIDDSGTAVLNDLWQVVISQDYTEVTSIPVTETYTGTESTQYVITIVSGGTVATDTLTVGFTTTNGADISSSFLVDSGASFPLDVVIGSFDMELTFDTAEEFNTGTVYTFDVEGESEGETRTLVLKDAVPLESTVTDIDLTLCVLDTFVITDLFVTKTADDITVSGSITTDSDLLGATATYSVVGGELFADYRELKTDNCNQVATVSSITDLEDILGPAVSSNPLSKAVGHALANSGGTSVFYIATCSDDKAGYTDALDVSTENDALYSMVPLSNDQEIKDLFMTHTLERSNEINNQWRISWFANTAADVIDVYTELSPGVDILSTVEEFSVGQFRKVVTAGALYLTNGVQPGDLFRINFATDPGTGIVTYDEFQVDRVSSETELILLGSLGAAITVALKSEVWRDQTRTEYANSLALEAARYNSRRIFLVYADNPIEDNGDSIELFYVAAALAGQRSGAAPHAPLSQVPLLGINLDMLQDWSRNNLNTIASGGNWIVTKDFSGLVFTRHQLSTVVNPDNFIEREQSKTTNLDDISRFFFTNTNDLFGQGNISPAMLALIGQRVDSLISQISNRSYPDKIGPQMLDAEVLELAQDPVLRDTIRIVIDPDMPDPLNVLQIRFTVS